MFGKCLDEYAYGCPMNNELKENYVKSVYNSIGRRELQLRELLLILKIYYYEETYIDNRLYMLINNSMTSIIIRSKNGYYTLEVDYKNKKIKVYDVYGKINCIDDLNRLKNCGGKQFKNIDTFKVENIKIETNFPEARDLLAVVIFMIRNNNNYKDVEVDKIDVVLMSDLIRIYLGNLLENQSRRLRDSIHGINLDDTFISDIDYEEIEHNGMNFVSQLRKGYSLEEWSYAKQYRKTYIDNCFHIISAIDIKHQITATEFILAIHYLSSNLNKVIDPTYVYTHKRRILHCIKESGIYYIPVCDEKLKHWTLWEVHYDDKKDLNIFIYDSKDFYTEERNNYKNPYRDEVFKNLVCIFEEYGNYDFNIVDTIVKQDNSDSTTCGYFTLFYLAARLNNVNIKDMMNIKNFKINFFIEDLKNGILNLTEEEKAKLYYNSCTKPKLYKLQLL